MRLCDHPKRVFVCSRYAGDIEHNTEIAKRLCRGVILTGHAPFAPHLFFPRLLDEQEAAQRELGITLGLAFMEAWGIGQTPCGLGGHRGVYDLGSGG